MGEIENNEVIESTVGSSFIQQDAVIVGIDEIVDKMDTVDQKQVFTLPISFAVSLRILHLSKASILYGIVTLNASIDSSLKNESSSSLSRQKSS